MAKIRVLIVDDSRMVQRIVSALLAEDPDIDVVGIANDAAEAETFFATAAVDAVTLDVEMPGMSGLEYLPTLCERAVPVVMVSTRVEREDPVREEALRRGAAACFPKGELFERADAFRSLVKAAAHRRVTLDHRDAAGAAYAA